MEVPNSIPIVVGVNQVGVFPEEKIPASVKNEVRTIKSLSPYSVCCIILPFPQKLWYVCSQGDESRPSHKSMQELFKGIALFPSIATVSTTVSKLCHTILWNVQWTLCWGDREEE